jgi:hypothetical protein
MRKGYENVSYFVSYRIYFGTWRKNYWTDHKKVWFFLSQIFSAVRNFKFQYDPFSNLKDVSQKSIPKLWSLTKMVYFIFRYLSMKLGTSVDGHEQNNNLKVSLKSPKI